MHRTLPWLFMTGGSGQVYAGYKITESIGIAAANVPNQGNAHFIAFVTIIPGVIIAMTGLFQAVTNHFIRQKRLEIEARVKRLEMGLPCDDVDCPIQRIAREGVPRPELFGTATKTPK